MAAAHLIHGSSDGRFKITYAADPKLMPEEIMRSVGYGGTDIGPMMKKYQPKGKETGWYEDNRGRVLFHQSPQRLTVEVKGEA